ncbi:hypothetical protein CAG61_06230 [Vibrio sp. V34_P3A8T189]|uniref:hypothetical protein n=1 Tax=unclassified Vibrio TaxID=2614977 RepID=UPI001372D4E9|nr:MULTISPECIES: hypothetical protein [unclassified Vibrio]EKO3626435.1 hypothetical protein [Vibrio metschnikovii]EKO3778375.1 hypothetical protein [Vibrio metschnikovii]NAX01458.1 hypothetical protein [Vibrio sp. V34_P3A8T189]NAX06982.1 hypothetical protein [Vibrio sp. V40_P2S30T141]
MSGQGYIACAHFEESIYHFGEADTPEKALAAFVEGGQFSEYCDCREIEDGTYVLVKVFKAIYADSPEANDEKTNMEDWEDGWQWILGEEVSEHQIQFLA